MSYCRFRNTESDLRDCLDNIDADLGGEEFEARESIIDIAKIIVKDWGEAEFINNEDEEK